MDLKGKRIFIVEDNLTNRAVMQLLLEQEGAIIAFERWGLDVIKRLHKFAPIDLILLDLMFPDNITGYEVFDWIRDVSDFADIPIVAVSASEPEIAIPKTHDKGFNGFIAKPIVDYLLFKKQIEKVLNGERVWYSG